MNKKYIVFGAGFLGKQAIELIGREQIQFFLDNNVDKQTQGFNGYKVYSIDNAIDQINNAIVVIAVSDNHISEIEKQLQLYGVNNYITLNQFKFEITKNKLLNRINYIDIYTKAIEWIKRNSFEQAGIVTCTTVKLPYPEVSGYFIPTLIRWGYKELAISYAKWLCNIQKESGAWHDSNDENPYIFDSAQILKGLIAVRDIFPDKNLIDISICKGCDWIFSNMTDEGRLVSPIKDAWGDEKTFSELIHTYCISPLKEAGVIFHIPSYIANAEKIARYYIQTFREKILDFHLLSHFYAYVLEAMLDIGEEDLAREAMKKIAQIQKKSGAVPAYKDVDWVCSTGLFQLAVIWFRLGDIEHGNKAFEYACKLQNKSGGWYGSYLSEENSSEKNSYFPTSEISWANKYFLDALYYKNIVQFNYSAPDFIQLISKNDGRYKAVRSVIKKAGMKVLDVGCGKGRYLRNLLEEFPQNKYYGVDISSEVLKNLDDLAVECREGTITCIPFKDNMFDVTYACEVLEHAVDFESSIREMTRVTKRGGIIIIIDKNDNCYGELEIGDWEQWPNEKNLMQIMHKYSVDVKINHGINYENEKNKDLFTSWVGIVK